MIYALLFLVLPRIPLTDTHFRNSYPQWKSTFHKYDMQNYKYNLKNGWLS